MRTKRQKAFELACTNSSLTSFDQLKMKKEDWDACFKMDLSGNRIRDFTDLPEMPKLTQLNLNDNPVVSFEGCRELPRLYWISLRNTPISRNVHFKLMCLIAFGNQLATINEEKVSNGLRTRANALRSRMLPLLQQGKVIAALNPLKWVDTRETVTNEVSNVKEKTEKQKLSVAAICERYLESDIQLPNDVLQQALQEIDEIRNTYGGSDFFEYEEEEANESDY